MNKDHQTRVVAAIVKYLVILDAWEEVHGSTQSMITARELIRAAGNDMRGSANAVTFAKRHHISTGLALLPYGPVSRLYAILAAYNHPAVNFRVSRAEVEVATLETSVANMANGLARSRAA